MRRLVSPRAGALAAGTLVGLLGPSAAEEPGGAAHNLVPSVAYSGEYLENEDPDTDIARFGLDAAPWMPQIIAMMNQSRGPGHEPQQIMLMRGAGGQLYLVLSWRRHWGKSWVEFYRVSELGDGRVRLTFLRQLDEPGTHFIDRASGDRSFPGEAPVVVIVAGGGNQDCDRTLHLIQLDRNTVEITPELHGMRLTNLLDLDGDGTAELISSVPGWTCAPRNGGIPVVLRRDDGRFVFACADFPELYQRWRDELLREEQLFVPEPARDFYHRSREALMQAQAGRVDEGIALMNQSVAGLLEAARQALDQRAWLARVDHPTLGWTLPLTALLELARSAAATGCPVAEAYDAVQAGWEAAGPPTAAHLE
jgi:hypothetical protein